ncbi:MAG: M61 family peptidase [Bacteroidota bacterium]
MRVRFTFGVLLCCAIAAPAQAQDAVRYDVFLDNAAHREALVTITIEDVPVDSAATAFRMSRTSPGRYALHEFAKNVYDVQAVNEDGDPLPIERADAHEWHVSGHNGTIVFSYRLFANRADGTYSMVDRTMAHFNMPASFAWVKDHEDLPIAIQFHKPEDWSVATQLVPTDQSDTFTAPDLAYFLDSPTTIGPHTWRSFEVTEGDETYEIRIALLHQGTDAEADDYAQKTQAIVEQAAAAFGGYPAFDYGTYTFMATYLPYASGDGMEHRNSTILTSTRPLATGMLRNLGTVSHEFIHAWNVERIRPESLQPFDFEASNFTNALWFAEGFTSYYDDLLLKRAGLLTLEEYATGIARGVDAVQNGSGRTYRGPIAMSQHAQFVDAANWVDPTSFRNTFISYYTYGAVIGLALDLTLRMEHGTTLDDYMQAVWAKHGATEAPYDMLDLQDILAEVTGDASFASTFFRRYIRGNELLDFGPLLAQAGMLLVQNSSRNAWIGDVALDFSQNSARVTTQTRTGTPLYAAGIDLDDQIMMINGQPVGNQDAWNAALSTLRGGAPAEIVFSHRGEIMGSTIAAQPDPTYSIVLYESFGLPITADIEAFREAWLGTK